MIPLHDDTPNSSVPVLTYTLIAINVIVWFLNLSDPQEWVIQFGLIPWELLNGQKLPESQIIGGIPSIFSSMFMHGGFMHLAGNMLYMYIFADNIENRLGTVRFALFYLIAGVGAALFQVGAVVMTSTIPQDPIPLAMVWSGKISSELAGSFVPMVGASGAIAGVLGAYAVLFPRAKVFTLVPLGFIFTTIRLPALALIGFWFVLQLISGMSVSASDGGVAWWAHIGGFVVGIAALYLLGGGTKRRASAGPPPPASGKGKYGEPKWH